MRGVRRFTGRDWMTSVGGSWIGRRSVGGAYRDGYAEGALGFAFVDAASGRNVGVVASEGDADVAVGADQVVGGVEGDPSQIGDEGFHPGVGRAFQERSFFSSASSSCGETCIR